MEPGPIAGLAGPVEIIDLSEGDPRDVEGDSIIGSVSKSEDLARI